MNAEIQAMIDQHNTLVNELAALDRALFDALAGLSGYHQARFSSGDLWGSSLLRHPDRSVIEGELSKHVHLITEAQ